MAPGQLVAREGGMVSLTPVDVKAPRCGAIYAKKGTACRRASGHTGGHHYGQAPHEARAKKRAYQHTYYRQKRESMTQKEIVAYNEYQRERRRLQAEANPEKRAAFLRKHAAEQRVRNKAKWESMTEEQKDAVRTKQREAMKAWRKKLLPDQLAEVRKRNRDRMREYMADPERRLVARRQSREKRAASFGLDPDALRRAEARSTACAICDRPFIKAARNRKESSIIPHIDHDHRTGQFRGLLCRWCNAGLGAFNDSQVTLRRAIEYLQTQFMRNEDVA